MVAAEHSARARQRLPHDSRDLLRGIVLEGHGTQADQVRPELTKSPDDCASHPARLQHEIEYPHFRAIDVRGQRGQPQVRESHHPVE